MASAFKLRSGNSPLFKEMGSSPLRQSAWERIKESKVGKFGGKVGKFLGMNTPMGRAMWTTDILSSWITKTLPDPQKQLKNRAKTETKGGSIYTSPKL